MSAMPMLLEPDDLLRLADGDCYELIDGRPVEKPMGARSDEIAGLLLTALNLFVRPQRLGRVYGAQTGYRCFPQSPTRVRLPDVSFVAAGRLTGDVSPEGHVLIAPDLAVESVSPHETYEEVEAKVRDYRSAGVRLVWVVSPGGRNVLVRRLDGTSAEVGEGGQLSGEGVLPGFACPVADLFS